MESPGGRAQPCNISFPWGGGSTQQLRPVSLGCRGLRTGEGSTDRGGRKPRFLPSSRGRCLSRWSKKGQQAISHEASGHWPESGVAAFSLLQGPTHGSEASAGERGCLGHPGPCQGSTPILPWQPRVNQKLQLSHAPSDRMGSGRGQSWPHSRGKRELKSVVLGPCCHCNMS